LQPYLYPEPPAQSKPAAEPAAVAAPPPVAPTPVKEKPDGSTSQADPPATEPPVRGGFPEDLEPSVVVPIPAAPPAKPETGVAPAVVPAPSP